MLDVLWTRAQNIAYFPRETSNMQGEDKNGGENHPQLTVEEAAWPTNKANF